VSYSLPPKPNLDYLRKQAKALLKDHKQRKPEVCSVLRTLSCFATATDDEILKDFITLGDMQFALAMAYGFSHWAELMSQADLMANGDSQERQRQRVVLPDHQAGDFGRSWDMPLRASCCLLKNRGIDLSFDKALVLSGEAFGFCHASHWQRTGYLAAPTNPVANLLDAHGFTSTFLHAGPTGPFRHSKSAEDIAAHTNRVLDCIRAEINNGRGVLAAGTEADCGGMSIIVGYEHDRHWFCHIGEGRPYRWVPMRGVAEGAVDEDMGLIDGRCRGSVTPGCVGGWQAYPIVMVGDRNHDQQPDIAVWKLALRRAVNLHTASSFHRSNWGGVDYHFGAQAYRSLAGELETLCYPDDAKGPFEASGPEPANGWYDMSMLRCQFDHLAVGRLAASQVLIDQAERAPHAEHSCLRQAARHYCDLAERAAQARQSLDERGLDHVLGDSDACAALAGSVRQMAADDDAAIALLGALI
jgi:hypothetical protein